MKRIIALSLVISIAISSASVFVYDRFFVQKIVVFDLRGFMQEQKTLYLKGMITDEDFKANLDTLETYLNTVPKNKLVVLGEMVVKHNAEVLPAPPGIKKFSLTTGDNKTAVQEKENRK